MNYPLTLSAAVNFAPATEVEEILQNVRTIVLTRLGTVPLFREFGFSWDHIDKPVHIARALIRADLIETIERWEPRAKVQSIEFDEDTQDLREGLTKPRIVLSIGEENG